MASCQWPTDTGFQAAKEGNIKTYCDILIALAQGARIHEDDLNQARTLLEHGALLDYTDAVCGRTPLIWAIVSGRKDLVEFFADMDASVIYTSDGASVLDTSDGKWDWTPAMWAVMENQNEILRILISKGADLNKMDGLRQRTALIWAASSGRHDSVGAILESRRAHIGLVDGAGMAPLACAYLGGHWKTAQLLLGAGDNANAEVHGASLLEWATIGTNKPFVQMLLEHGGLPNSTNSEGIPLLILAIKRNSPEIVVLLINAGADVQCTDRSGFTALMWAIWHSNMEIVAILVAAKANLYAKDNRGTTVQALAKQSGSVEIIQLVSKPG